MRSPRRSAYRARRGCDRRADFGRRPAVLHRRRHQRTARRAGASECPPTFSVPRTGAGHHRRRRSGAFADATEATEDDPASVSATCWPRLHVERRALVGIAASGRTPYVSGAIAEARRLGRRYHRHQLHARLRAVARRRYRHQPLAGPGDRTGSTRMKAGTATKLVLNMLTTALHPPRLRLRQPDGERAAEEREAAWTARAASSRRPPAYPYERAAELLDEAGQRVRRAIVMAKRGAGRDDSRGRLAAQRPVAGSGEASNMDKFVIEGGTPLEGEIRDQRLEEFRAARAGRCLLTDDRSRCTAFRACATSAPWRGCWWTSARR